MLFLLRLHPLLPVALNVLWRLREVFGVGATALDDPVRGGRRLLFHRFLRVQ